jgi:hypothetical protein
MKSLGAWVIAFLASLSVASCSSVPRIDGSSQAAFVRSHAVLVASLSPGDQMRLSLAEILMLSPKNCLTRKPIPGQPFLNKMLGGQTDLSSCRKELNGLTFNDIMHEAYPQGESRAAGN